MSPRYRVIYDPRDDYVVVYYIDAIRTLWKKLPLEVLEYVIEQDYSDFIKEWESDVSTIEVSEHHNKAEVLARLEELLLIQELKK